MTGQTVLKRLFIIEGVFAIHRNYSLLNKRLRRFVICHVCIQLTLLMLCLYKYILLAIDFYHFAPNRTLDLVIYLYSVVSSTINNIVAILFAVVRSKDFKVYVKSIESIKNICENDVLFKTRTATETRRFYIDVSVMLATIVTWVFLTLYDVWDRFRGNYFGIIMFYMSRILECRVFIESIVFYELSELIGVRMRYLNDSISEVVDTVDDRTESGELQRLSEEMEKWGEINKLLASACAQLRDCLGTQITMSLYSVSILYITLLYSVVHYFINQKFLWQTNGWIFTLTLSLYLTVKLLILGSGQRVQWQADALDTRLARLWRVLLTRREAVQCARAVRSLRRRMRHEPVRVRLHEALPTRMSQLVDIVGTVVAYTIVLLQLNHVV